MTPYTPDTVIYHDNCDDGFTAAWVAVQKWGRDLDLIPMNYNQSAPNFEGRNVLVVDFSFPPLACAELIARGNRVVMLDHHKTAQEALSGVIQPDGLTHANAEEHLAKNALLAQFDMDRSGARMTWDFCFPGGYPPELVLAVEDRDLWRFQRPGTKEISIYLRSMERTVENWNAVNFDLQHRKEVVLAAGGALLGYKDRLVADIANQASQRRFYGYADVAVVECCPYPLVSEVCHELLKRYPDAPFAVAAVRTNGGTTISMRSTDDREDVSAIAKSHGGGGHRNAAGFRQDG